MAAPAGKHKAVSCRQQCLCEDLFTDLHQHLIFHPVLSKATRKDAPQQAVLKGSWQLQSSMIKQHRLGQLLPANLFLCAQVELPAKVHSRRASIAGPAPSSYMSPRRTSVAVISGVSLMPPDELHPRQDGLRGALPSALRARHHAGQFLKWNMCKPAWSCNQCEAFLPAQAVPRVMAFSPMTALNRGPGLLCTSWACLCMWESQRQSVSVCRCFEVLWSAVKGDCCQCSCATR